MRKYKQKELLSEVLEDVICDICGKSCKINLSALYEFSILKATWGYGSHKDCTQWDGEFCEECSGKLKIYIESLGGNLRIANDYDYFNKKEEECQN